MRIEAMEAHGNYRTKVLPEPTVFWLLFKNMVQVWLESNLP